MLVQSGGLVSAAIAYKQSHELTTYGFEEVSYEYTNLDYECANLIVNMLI